MDKPSETDSDDFFDEEGTEDTDTSQEDTQKEEEHDQESNDEVTLAELNELAGRDGDRAFKSKDDFNKHYANLAALVGKQPPKEKKAGKPVESNSDLEAIKAEIAEIKSAGERDKFLTSNPTAKENLDLLEAYADKKGVTLSEAWEEKKDVFAQDDNREVGIKSRNRVAPVRQDKNLQALKEQASSGSAQAQEELTRKMLHG